MADKKKKPRSNIENMQLMSLEKLAALLCAHGFCVDKRCPRLWEDINCVECVMEWLKTETIDY